MPKERIPHTTDADGDEHHPAFGMISVHRISANPGEVLFQSDVRHHEYVRIEVHEATRQRDLKHDWVHPHKLVCEVSMSMAQFASFVASGGTSGVPCTIDFTGSGAHAAGSRPGLKLAPRLQLSHDELRESADKAYGNIQEAFTAYQETLSDTGKGSTAARKSALRTLQNTIANAAGNVAYAAKQLDEHAEKVIEQSRADVEAMVTQAAQRLGVAPEQLALTGAEEGEINNEEKA